MRYAEKLCTEYSPQLMCRWRQLFDRQGEIQKGEHLRSEQEIQSVPINRITTNDQRGDLDKRIDSGVPNRLNFPERNAAILHTLRALELHWLDLERIRNEQGDAVAEVLLDVAIDAAHLCLLWIHKLVSLESPLITPIVTTQKDIEECRDLIALAARYAEMSDVMGILWLDQAATTEIAPGEVELEYTSDQIRYQAAQWLWRLELKPDVFCASEI